MHVLSALALAAATASVAAATAGGCDPSKWQLPVDGKYNTAGKVVKDKLNVHLIPHSHDDPGWLITVDQYYYQRVQFILDTVVVELLENPDRKFMFVEQSFFQRWWHEQSDHTKTIVKKLVHDGRLDLSVNGGWCMQDEAAPHYIAMVDQTAYGHQLLKQEFNVTPRIGWQIDPFGHSSTQGSLMSSGVGFDALYFARIDYQDYDKRFNNKDLEFIWRPSKSRGKAQQVFTGNIIDHYGSPGHFHYENDIPVQDDPAMHDFNVCDQVNWFVDNMFMRGNHSRGNHIFIPMGDDFSYQNARKYFKSMDKLIHYVNQDGRVNVLYSNLSYYTDLKLAEDIPWALKTDDFFPYASQDHEYWSGYFTSRPALKRFARVGNILLQQLRQLDAVYESHHSAELEKLQRGVGLVQHHDGISGTEKQVVSDDYALRINEGVVEAEKELNNVLFVIGEKEKFQFCLQRNTSICEVTRNTEKVEIFVHNALARKTMQTIVIPIDRKAAKVTALGGAAGPKNVVVYKNLPVHAFTNMELPYKISFTADLEPLGSSRYLLEQFDSPMDEESSDEESTFNDVSTVVLENDAVEATIDTKTGMLVSITNNKKKVTLPVSLDVGYYLSYQGPKGRHSGAYLFRPDSNKTYPVTSKAGVNVTLVDVSMGQNEAASRIAFKIGDWVTIEYILKDSDEFVDVEWTVGPIPVEDKKGKEVILRFDTQKAIQSQGTWYTDSNGLEFVTRVRNHRDTWDLKLHDDQEVVAANYFPITTGAYMRDSKYQLNIVTDRAQGVASLKDGEMEVMVHRRLLMDDQKGVSEHLNETESYVDPTLKKTITKGLIIRGNLLVNVDAAGDEGMKSIRSKMEQEFFKPLSVLRKAQSTDVAAKVPWLTVSEFPENVGLTTLVELSKKSLLVRLTHLYAVDEHSSLSKTVSFDFSKYFKVKNAVLSEVTEMTLSGTEPIAESRRANNLKWKVRGEGENDVPVNLPIPVQGTTVHFQAMEVRAFRITFEKHVGTKEPAMQVEEAAVEEVVAKAVLEIEELMALE